MHRFLPKVAGLLLAAVFVLPAQAQPANKPFPVNTVEAKAALQVRLKAIGTSAIDAIESRATLQRLATELGDSYSDVPALEEIKRLLFLMAGPVVQPQLDLVDPDRAPLKLSLDGQMAGFARQLPRTPNPDLQHVRQQTWPPDLTHGELIALQTYSDNAFGLLNQELRTKGTVSPINALVHDRLQSAFRKAQPFNPPIRVSRGLQFDGNALDNFLKGLREAHKESKPYVMLGYSSTSVGSNFLFDGNVRLHINAVHGLDVFTVSLYPDERELLLNHKAIFLVKEIKMDQGRWLIYLDQLPPKVGAAGLDDKKSVGVPLPHRSWSRDFEVAAA